jgi:hypothetical protein
MLTFCCVTLSTMVWPQRPSEPIESLPASSLPTFSPSGHHPLTVPRSRGALAAPRHGLARAPPLLFCSAVQPD